MKTFQGYQLIKPEDLHWRLSNLMKIPNADYLERTGSENLGARLWRLPAKSANTLHKHIRSEEFYFVLEGVGRMRVGEETLTVPKYGGVLVGPNELRQVFNDTESRGALAHRWRAGGTGILARREDQARHVAHLSDRPDAVAKRIGRRGVAAEDVICSYAPFLSLGARLSRSFGLLSPFSASDRKG